jgi:hypothetical protein
MNKWQWRGIVGVLFALSLVLGWSASTAVAQVAEICDNKVDDDGDKLIDLDDPDCKKPPTGTPCSPGFWKTEPHRALFDEVCQDAADLNPLDQFVDCDDLFTALTCPGRDSTCGRSAAAALLNQVSGCVE